MADSVESHVLIKYSIFFQSLGTNETYRKKKRPAITLSREVLTSSKIKMPKVYFGMGTYLEFHHRM